MFSRVAPWKNRSFTRIRGCKSPSKLHAKIQQVVNYFCTKIQERKSSPKNKFWVRISGGHPRRYPSGRPRAKASVKPSKSFRHRCPWPEGADGRPWPQIIDLLMGLFRGAVFRRGRGARKQPMKQPTEMPTSTMARMGRFPSLMGRFPSSMGVSPISSKGAVLPLDNPGKQLIKKRAWRGSWPGGVQKLRSEKLRAESSFPDHLLSGGKTLWAEGPKLRCPNR